MSDKTIDNNKKILHLLKGQQQLEVLMSDYLDVLKSCQEEQENLKKYIGKTKQVLILLERSIKHYIRQVSSKNPSKVQIEQYTYKYDKLVEILELKQLKQTLLFLRQNYFLSYRRFLTTNTFILLKKLQQTTDRLYQLEPNLTGLQELTELNNFFQNYNLLQTPDPTELLEKIHAIRNRQFYISRGYQVLKYVRPVYSSLTALRRALVQRAKYKGTNNAWHRYCQAVTALESYYHGHYIQAGGQPRNYHGHFANERP